MKRTPLLRKTRLRSTSRLTRKTRLRPVSKKRIRINKAYSLLREAYLQVHPYCEAWLQEMGLKESDVDDSGCVILDGKKRSVPLSCDIHHKAQRVGGNMLNTDTWLAVSRPMHDWLHANPREAEKRGWIIRQPTVPRHFPSHD